MGNLLKNWKTTLMGVASVATGISLIASGNTEGGVSAILAGIGLIFAKDVNQTGVV